MYVRSDHTCISRMDATDSRRHHLCPLAQNKETMACGLIPHVVPHATPQSYNGHHSAIHLNHILAVTSHTHASGVPSVCPACGHTHAFMQFQPSPEFLLCEVPWLGSVACREHAFTLIEPRPAPGRSNLGHTRMQNLTRHVSHANRGLTEARSTSACAAKKL